MAKQARLDRLLQPVEALAAVALMALMAVVFVSVSLRFFFNYIIPDQFDLSRMFLGIAVFWGIAAACSRDEYVRGDMFMEKLPPAARALIDWFGRLVILACLAVLLWKVWGKTLDVRRSGELTSELRIGIWPFYAVMCAGAVVAVAGVFASLVTTLSRGFAVEPQSPPEHPEETAI